jgi:acetyl/propionyl-CoA carboxylase alpha subunit
MPFEITLGSGEAHTVEIVRRATRATVTIDGRDHLASLRPAGDASELTFDTRTERVWTVVDGDTIWVHALGRAWELSLVDPVERARAGVASEDMSLAPMPGTVITVAVGAGESVSAGQPLVVIESMKMQSEIVAPRDGVVEQVFLAVGETFDRGAPLVSLAAEATEADEADEAVAG